MIRFLDRFLTAPITIILFFISFITLGFVPVLALAGANFMTEYSPLSIILLTPFFIVMPLLILRIGYGFYWGTILIKNIKNNPELDNWDFLEPHNRAFGIKAFSKRYSIPPRASIIILEMLERQGSMEKFYFSKGRVYEFKHQISKGKSYTRYYRPRTKQ